MKSITWLQDTIVLRFALTIILAVLVTLSLVYLFFIFGGKWAQPEIDDTELPGEVVGITRVVAAAPAQMRQALAAAASTSTARISLHDPASPVSKAIESATDVEDGRYLIHERINEARRSVVIINSGSSVAKMPALRYDRTKYPDVHFLAVKLADGSWLVFTALNRDWGLPRYKRWAVWLVFLTLSIGVVSVVAARQLSRPIERLATAVRLFGHDPRAPAVSETGPQELRQVIKTFNAMQAQVQKFLSDRTMMLAAISHDLRTPLTRVRLRGEFIEDHEQRARLFHDVDEMQAMIDGALAFFRDDATEEDATTFNLSGVISTIVNDYADQGIDISYAGLARATYWGRPFALKRAIANLTENAIKYGTPPEIELSCVEKTLVITVSDRGPGIPPDALDRVFSPYFRLDKSRNRTTGGVGLGLTVTQSIIRGHGGTITLGNRSGGGLEARITLPVVM